MALRVATGTYTGDGNDSRNITVSPSFAIKAVIIKKDNSTGAVMSISGMGDLARDLSVISEALAANKIQSMGTGTFQIGSDTAVNATSNPYYWIALGGDDAEIVASSYTGNGLDDRTITTNFLPEFVLVIGNGTYPAVIRYGGISTDESISFAGAGDLLGVNRIQSFEATGFVVGTANAVNENTATFYYLAIKTTTNSYTASYAGNGSDNRDITAPNFLPEAVLIKGPVKNGCFLTTTLDSAAPGDYAVFDALANQLNGIQDLISTGFQVGTNERANASGTTYYYYAVKDNAVAGPANLKTNNTNVAANVKTINTNTIANVKTLNTNA